MKFRSESTIPHPRDAVFAAYRDNLPEVIRFLDDISAVNVLAREETGGVVKLHNEWVSERDIPSVAQQFIKPEHLRWDDHASWDASSYVCHFDIRTRAFTDAVRCDGTNTFVDDPKGTRVILEGTFEVTNIKVPGVPSFLAKRLVPQIESFIIGLVRPNLEKVNEAVGRYLDTQG